MKNAAVLTLFFLCCLVLPSTALAGGILKDIQFKPLTEQAEQITFVLNGIYMPKSFILKGDKPRIVFDFPNVARDRSLPNRISTKGNLVQRIRVGVHKEKVPTVRVVFDIRPGKLVWYRQDFDRNTNRLTITVQPTGPETGTQSLQKNRTVAAGTGKKIEYTATAPRNAPEQPVAAKVREIAKKAADTVPRAEQPAPPPVTAKTEQAAKPSGPKDPFAVPAMEDLAATKPAAQPPPAQTKKTVTSPEPKPEPKPAAKEAESPSGKTAQTQPVKAAKESGKAAESKAREAEKAVSSPAGSASGKSPLLQSVEFDDSSNRGEMILFKLNDFYPPVVFGLEEGTPRVVCDFKNTRAAESIPTVIKANGRLLKTIRIGKYNNPRKVRVVLDLAPNNSYDLQQVFFKEDNLFVIIINTMDNALSPEDVKKIL